jgi:tetratricopeptide (TPR) repeat protein
MKFHSFFIFFITFCLSFYSQKTIDTQKKFQEISAVPDSPKKVDQLISLYKKVSKKEKNVEFIIDKAISIAEKNNYTNKIAKAYSRKGINARYKFNYGKSVEYHKIALNYLENSKDTLLKIKCLNSIGVTCRKLNLEKQAFNYYFKALQLSEKFKSDKSIAIALNGIGNVFIDIEDYDKALYYFKKALLFEIKTNNVKGQEYDLANIGETYIKSGIYDSAKVYLKKSLEKSLKRDNKLSIAIKYNLLGLLYQKKKNMILLSIIIKKH